MAKAVKVTLTGAQAVLAVAALEEFARGRDGLQARMARAAARTLREAWEAAAALQRVREDRAA